MPGLQPPTPTLTLTPSVILTQSLASPPGGRALGAGARGWGAQTPRAAGKRPRGAASARHTPRGWHPPARTPSPQPPGTCPRPGRGVEPRRGEPGEGVCSGGGGGGSGAASPLPPGGAAAAAAAATISARAAAGASPASGARGGGRGRGGGWAKGAGGRGGRVSLSRRPEPERETLAAAAAAAPDTRRLLPCSGAACPRLAGPGRAAAGQEPGQGPGSGRCPRSHLRRRPRRRRAPRAPPPPGVRAPADRRRQWRRRARPKDQEAAARPGSP